MFREYTQHAQQSLLNTASWMNPRIKEKVEKSWAPLFYEHVFSQIDEKPFAVLYDEQYGAANFPVNILLSLELIKSMKEITDIELMELYDFDYLINYAMGNWVLGGFPLSERTIYNFRERLYRYTMEHDGSEDIMFGQFTRLLKHFSEASGLLMDEQRIDTTMFMSNIKKAGRLTLCYDILTRGAKAVPEAKATETVKTVLSANFKKDVLQKVKADQTQNKITLLLGYCEEILALLESEPETKATDEARIMKRFIAEQTKTDETGQVVAKENKEIKAESLQSAFDEGATYREKNKVKQSGYVASITETCSKENDFQLITDYAVKPNIASDVEILEERIESISASGCKELYADGGFYSGDIIAKSADNEIEMHYTDMTGRAPDPAKLTAKDFQIDMDSQIIQTCPAGHKPTRTNVTKEKTVAHFDKSACAGCEIREHCPMKENKKNTVVRISKNSIQTDEQREKIASERTENTGKRAAIEGTNSALKQKGLDHLKVRGQAKVTVVSGLMVIAQNIKRFIRYMQGGYPPKQQPIKTQGIIMPILG